ncbi:hypothetical protein C1645_763398 [Glomus cerebriforme]|uniref:Uncharacterized protein n=1 Tax=Glomus cerebriforme TaxID=658196 RepID=A0A397TDV9_9GLOM|nr:hypothetical protein C1645_763398 [Glomus cerebriforme]
MDDSHIFSYQQEDDNSNFENETEDISISVEGSINENTEDSTFSLLDKESQSIDSIKDKEEYDDNNNSLTNQNLLVTESNESNDNITSTQNEQGSKDEEDEEDLEHIESPESPEHQDYDDQEMLFVHHPESDDTASENSLSMSSGMLVSPDIRTPSSPSQYSDDNNSIESMPIGDVIDSLSNSSNQSERDMTVIPAPGETRSQILAPLDVNEDEDYDEGRIQLTPIITKAIETDDDPPSPTLPEFSPTIRREVDINTNNNYSNINDNNKNRNHLPRLDLLLGHQRTDFLHRRNSEIAWNIFHHQILLPFFQGFSWGIGIHLYRYMRNGFSIRSFWRSLPGGARGTSSN